MKKIIPIFLALGLCVSLPTISRSETSKTNASSELISTYLVLTENGLYDGKKGENFKDLFLENTIKYEAEAGSQLPDETVVTSTVNGVTFNGWVNYIGAGVPTGYTTVPNKNNTILYASWVHDGSSTPDIPGGGEDTGSTMRVYFKSPTSWTNANIYYWGTSSQPVQWPGVAMNKDSELNLWYYDYDTTLYSNVIFNDGTNQSEDLHSPTSETSDCYVWNNGWYNEDTTEVPPTIDTSAYDYFLVPGPWAAANAWFAAWVWGTGAGQWVTLTKLDSNLAGFDLPEDVSKIIFVRFNPTVSTPTWENGVWNQTGDLNIPSNGSNCYTITGWGTTDGSWSVL